MKISLFILISLLTYFCIESDFKDFEIKNEVNPYLKLTTPFIKNNGNYPEYITHFSKTLNYTFYLTIKGQLCYLFHKDSTYGFIISEKLSANQKLFITNSDSATFHSNYLMKNKTGSRTKVAYNKIIIRYPDSGVIVQLTNTNSQIEKIIQILPDHDPNNVWFKMEGADSLIVSANGKLLISTNYKMIEMSKPVAWQVINDKKVFIKTNYKTKNLFYGFELNDYDKNETIIIDPIISSTFISGSYYDKINDIEIDSNKNILIGGYTYSGNLPTTSEGFDTLFDDLFGFKQAAFVAKISPDLNNILGATFLEGNGASNASCTDLLIDETGNIYLTGNAGWSGFPVTANAFDTTHNATKAFISCLTGDLSHMLFSSLFGGTQNTEMAAGTTSTKIFQYNGKVGIAGKTNCNNLPVTSHALDTSYNGNTDAYIAIFNKSLSNLLFSSYIGGNGNDGINSVCTIDSNLYLTGYTKSLDFPVTGHAYQTPTIELNKQYGFICCVNDTLSRLLFSSRYCEGSGISINGNDTCLYVGSYASENAPTTSNVLFEQPPLTETYQGLISCFSLNLSQLKYSSFFPGNITDLQLAKDKVFITGNTMDSIPRISLGDLLFSENLQSKDIFVSSLTTNLQCVVHSARFGGIENDYATCSKLFDQKIVIGGNTFSYNYPTTVGSINSTFIGGYSLWQGEYCDDMFVTILDVNLSDNHRAIYASAGPNGKITPDSMVVLSDTSDVSFSFIPDPGYSVFSVKIDNNTIGNPEHYTFYSVFEDHFIHVIFDTINTISNPQNYINNSVITWPNPSGEIVRFLFVNFLAENVNIYSITGEIIKSTQIKSECHSFEWDGFDLNGNKSKSGIYLIAFSNKKLSIVCKIIRK